MASCFSPARTSCCVLPTAASIGAHRNSPCPGPSPRSQCRRPTRQIVPSLWQLRRPMASTCCVPPTAESAGRMSRPKTARPPGGSSCRLAMQRIRRSSFGQERDGCRGLRIAAPPGRRHPMALAWTPAITCVRWPSRPISRAIAGWWRQRSRAFLQLPTPGRPGSRSALHRSTGYTHRSTATARTCCSAFTKNASVPPHCTSFCAPEMAEPIGTRCGPTIQGRAAGRSPGPLPPCRPTLPRMTPSI